MRIHVLVEPISGDGYRARGAGPFPDIAEGATPDEALAGLKKLIQLRLEGGARLVTLDVSSGTHVWLPFAGMFQESDPIIQSWLQAMQSQRN